MTPLCSSSSNPPFNPLQNKTVEVENINTKANQMLKPITIPTTPPPLSLSLSKFPFQNYPLSLPSLKPHNSINKTLSLLYHHLQHSLQTTTSWSSNLSTSLTQSMRCKKTLLRSCFSRLWGSMSQRDSWALKMVTQLTMSYPLNRGIYNGLNIFNRKFKKISWITFLLNTLKLHHPRLLKLNDFYFYLQSIK